MKKYGIVTSVIAAGVLLSGCGSSDNCRFDTQNALDNKNYDQAISSAQSCSEYSDEDKEYIIATAYMGKAGFSFSDIIVNMSESNEESSGDGFANFVSKNSGGAESFTALAKAKKHLNNYLGTAACTDTNLTVAQKDACLNLSLTDTATASTTVSLLMDKDDIQSWADKNATGDRDWNGNGTPDSMDATTFAMQYALNPGYSDSMITLEQKGSVSFADINKTYTYLDINVTDGGTEGNMYYRLLNQNNETAPVEGWCDADYNKVTDRTRRDDSSIYPCPVDTNVSNEQIIIDTINDSTDNLTNLFPNEDIDDDVNAFKNEIDKDNDGIIEKEDVIGYLEKRNGGTI